jgi:hypothetical protein
MFGQFSIHREPNRWHVIAAGSGGASHHLYSDAREVALRNLNLATAFPRMQMAPEAAPWANGGCFAGKIAGFTRNV